MSHFWGVNQPSQPLAQHRENTTTHAPPHTSAVLPVSEKPMGGFECWVGMIASSSHWVFWRIKAELKKSTLQAMVHFFLAAFMVGFKNKNLIGLFQSQFNFDHLGSTGAIFSSLDSTQKSCHCTAQWRTRPSIFTFFFGLFSLQGRLLYDLYGHRHN